MLFSRRPSKQLMFFWVISALRKLRVQTALDIACGNMNFYPYIKANHYTGVDLDADRIDTGLAKHPNATGVVCSIEEMNESLRANLVLCLETIGFNHRFDSAFVMPCLQKLIDSTLQEGTLIVNMGATSAAHFEESHALLNAAFCRIDRYDYGALSARLWRATAFCSVALAVVMRLFRTLRISRKTPCCLFIAHGKKW